MIFGKKKCFLGQTVYPFQVILIGADFQCVVVFR